MAECKLIRGGAGFHGKQGLEYFSGVSAESTGAKAICMHLLEMPPGASARAHCHQAHETAIFVLEGTAEMRHGRKLEHVMRVEAGDFVYIPAGVPHQPYNPTARAVRAVIARTDPNEQESVVLLEDMEMARVTIVSEALIAQRAHAIWEKEGRPHGRDREHWSQAREELSGGAVAKAKEVRKTPPAAAAVRVPKSPKGKSKQPRPKPRG